MKADNIKTLKALIAECQSIDKLQSTLNKIRPFIPLMEDINPKISWAFGWLQHSLQLKDEYTPGSKEDLIQLNHKLEFWINWFNELFNERCHE